MQRVEVVDEGCQAPSVSVIGSSSLETSKFIWVLRSRL